jgi:hypothetical protein
MTIEAAHEGEPIPFVNIFAAEVYAGTGKWVNTGTR